MLETLNKPGSLVGEARAWCLIRRVSKLNNAAFLAIARRRDELKRSEVAARENKVTLMRKYRTGELPDVQRVSVAAFLAPLGVHGCPPLLPSTLLAIYIAPSFTLLALMHEIDASKNQTC